MAHARPALLLALLLPGAGLAACTVERCPEPRYAPQPDEGAGVGDAPAAPVVPPDAVGRACGSRGLAPCPEGTFCLFPPGASCGEADAPGECTVAPDLCTEQYQPVCGCDGTTYGNECSAHSVSVSVRHAGECAAGGGAVSGGCQRGGCSGELCVPEGSDAVSPCIWRPEFACYDRATCARGDDGTCAWRDTLELRSCLASETP